MEPPIKTGKIIGWPNQGTHAPGANGLPAIWENNNAVDIATPYGTPVYAPMAGTVGNEFGAIDTSTLPGNQQAVLQGLRMHIIGNQNEVYLQHLSKFAPGIEPGVNVTEGELIGYSGEANGVQHVHFAVKRGSILGWLKGLHVSKGQVSSLPNPVPSGSTGSGGGHLQGCATAVVMIAGSVAGFTYFLWSVF